MPAFALAWLGSLLNWLVGSKAGRWTMLAIAAAAAFGIYTFTIEQRAAERARAEIVAKEQKATELEHQRREHVLEQAQREGATLAARLSATEKHNADLQAQIARLSARHDGDRCLDRDSADRLRSIGGDRQAPGRRTRDPGR